MASRRTVELVQATVPALQAHGLALTTHFYTRMFTHEPELKNIFNLGNHRLAASSNRRLRRPCLPMPTTTCAARCPSC